MVFNKEKVVSNSLTLLGIKNDVLNKLVEKDKECIKYYERNIKLIPVSSSKQLYRLRLMNLSNECIGMYVIKLVKKLVILVDLKTKIINNYWNNKEFYCGCKRGTMCFSRKNGKWCNQKYL